MKAQVLGLDNGVMLVRVLLAVALGAALGIEREIDGQPAGFRTHVVLCLGAALFGLISVHAFAPFQAVRANTNVQIDVTRVASQVVVGVGFLGGGAILKHGASIRGLTTAASMWVAAAIGLAVGVGYYWPAVAVTVATLVSLVGFRGARGWIRRRFARQRAVISLRLVSGALPRALVASLQDLPRVSIRNIQIDRSGEQIEVSVELKGELGVRVDRLIAELADRDDVQEVSSEET